MAVGRQLVRAVAVVVITLTSRERFTEVIPTAVMAIVDIEHNLLAALVGKLMMATANVVHISITGLKLDARNVSRIKERLKAVVVCVGHYCSPPSSGIGIRAARKAQTMPQGIA